MITKSVVACDELLCLRQFERSDSDNQSRSGQSKSRRNFSFRQEAEFDRIQADPGGVRRGIVSRLRLPCLGKIVVLYRIGWDQVVKSSKY